MLFLCLIVCLGMALGKSLPRLSPGQGDIAEESCDCAVRLQVKQVLSDLHPQSVTTVPFWDWSAWYSPGRVRQGRESKPKQGSTVCEAACVPSFTYFSTLAGASPSTLAPST